MKLHPKFAAIFAPALLVCGLIGGGIATAQSSGIEIDLSQELEELRENTTGTNRQGAVDLASENSNPPKATPDVNVNLQLLTVERREIS